MFVINKLDVAFTGNYKLNPNHKVTFSKTGALSKESIKLAFDFSYDMTFGSGYLRENAHGGNEKRKLGATFANCFQGKLAEFAFYEFSTLKGIDISYPDLTVNAKGIWDSADFIAGKKKITIKSTKSYGNLLMLEKSMWSADGIFVDEDSPYDLFLLIRLHVDIEKVMCIKNEKSLDLERIDKDELWNYFSELPKDSYTKKSYRWDYDIPGYGTLELIQNAVINKNILRAGDLFNFTKIKVDNYYLLACDFLTLDSFEQEFKK